MPWFGLHEQQQSIGPMPVAPEIKPVDMVTRSVHVRQGCNTSQTYRQRCHCDVPCRAWLKVTRLEVRQLLRHFESFAQYSIHLQDRCCQYIAVQELLHSQASY
jgi:hypothetical protein